VIRSIHAALLIIFSSFLSFAAPLGYFLLNCGIFIKLSINQIGLLQSLKIMMWHIKLSWYKKLSFGINICSYLLGSFQNFLEEVLTHNFLVVEVGWKIFFICTLEMVVRLRRKHSTYTLQLLLWVPLKSTYSHIRVGVGAPLKV